MTNPVGKFLLLCNHIMYPLTRNKRHIYFLTNGFKGQTIEIRPVDRLSPASAVYDNLYDINGKMVSSAVY